MDGWIKLHRKALENPVVCKDAEYLAVWVYLLLKATHGDYPVLFRGQKTVLRSGQLITGRKKISEHLKIGESKVNRILQTFKAEQQIEQLTSNRNSLITIVNWEIYQECEQRIEQPVNNRRTTGEQQANTNKNKRTEEQENQKDNMSPEYEYKGTRTEYPYKDVIDYLNQKADTAYRATSKDSRKHIKARFDEGYTLDDFKEVIGKKVVEWKDDPRMSPYLRPSTLFGSKFEGYLNQPQTQNRNPQNRFNNFEQRSYDYDDLERQLLQSQSRKENKNE